MPLHAVIDTNVLVSAFLKSPSVPRTVIEHVFARKVVPLYNDGIIAEYSDVLHRPKFHFPKQAVGLTIRRIKEIGLAFSAAELEEKIPDPKDAVFYAVTMNARNETDAYLVTGNIKHFPDRAFVVTPRQMLGLIERAGGTA